MTTKYRTVSADEYKRNRDEVTIQVYDTEVPSWEARLALILIEKWGMATWEAEGEDSTGRQKVRLLSPDEIVSRACETAGKAIGEFRSRGWSVETPDLSELNTKLAALPE